MRHLRIISSKFPHGSRTPKSPLLGFFQSNSFRNFNSPAQEPIKNAPSEKILAIADEISALTLLEVADLTNLLGKKLEVKDMPLVSLMMPGMGFSLGAVGGRAVAAPASAEEKKEEKTVFDLKLEGGFDAGAKIKIIKEVRSFTELGLKEAKELVEKAPAVLKKGLTKEEGQKIIDKMKEVGAKVIME